VEKVWTRNRLCLTLAAVAAFAFLLACGSAEQPASKIPVRAGRPANAGPTPSTLASLLPPEPVTAPASPSGAPSARAEQTAIPAPEEPEARPSPAPAPVVDSSGSRVFSNKDLRRYQKVKEEFGFRDGEVTVDLSGRKPDDAQGQGAAPLSEAQRAEEITTTRDKIAALDSEAQYLRSRIPSLHNPFLPRVTLTEADKVTEAGMDNAQRLERVTSRLAEVDAELNVLQRRFAELSQMKPAGTPSP
jgi:DNA-binding transcriptional MerR regulator